MARLTFKLVKDIFNIDQALTRSLYDNFGVTSPDWASPQMYWFVIFHKQEWVGYGGLRSHGIEGEHNLCYTGPTLIRSAWRGQGLQVKLIKKRLRLAKKLGYTKVISSTLVNNYASNNNLIKCGFKMRKPWLEQESDSLYWEKLI